MTNSICLRASIITATNGEATLNFAISNDPLTHFIIKTLSTEAPSMHVDIGTEHEWARTTVDTEMGRKTVLIHVNDAIRRLKLLGFNEEVARSALEQENISRLLIRKKSKDILALLGRPTCLKENLKTVVKYIEENRSNFINGKRDRCLLHRESQIYVSFYANTGRIQLKARGLKIDYNALEIDYPIHNAFQRLSRLRGEEVLAIHDYIVSNRTLLFTQQDQYLKKRDTGLARSLFINKEGQIFLLRNNKKAGDSLIGEGTFKKVVLAINLSTSKIIASASQISTQGIFNEIEALQALQCVPGTLELLGHLSYFSSKNSFDKTRLFIPYFDKGALYNNIEQNTLSLEDKKRIFEVLIRNVALIHEAGYLHRDIKPQNILLSPNDQGELIPILIDYGNASHHTNQQELLRFKGTPQYLSPECLWDFESGSRPLPLATHFNDAWALGVTLYQLFTDDLRPYPFKDHRTPSTYKGYANAFLEAHPIYDHPFDPTFKTPLDIVYALLHQHQAQRISVVQAQKYLAKIQWQQKDFSDV